jgi:hypothetical protein
MVDAEDWLYGTGFDSDVVQYSRQLSQLRTLSDPIENRLSEDTQRGPIIEGLYKNMDSAKALANNRDPVNAHITEGERDILRNEVSKVQLWINDQMDKQNKLGQSSNPSLTIESLKKARQAFLAMSLPIISKKAPIAPG